MTKHRILHCCIALSILIFPSCLGSKKPLSDPNKATIDKQLLGSWKHISKETGETIFLHFGKHHVTNKLTWMKLAYVELGKNDKINAFQMVGFPCKVGDHPYANIANIDQKKIPNLTIEKTSEKLLSLVKGYFILKYQIKGNQLDIWSADVNFVSLSIKAGKIKGSGGTIDDTTENFQAFIKANDKKIFPEKNRLRFTKVK